MEKLLAKLENKSIDGALITCEENVFYFSGFRGDSTQVLITKDEVYLFTDFRYSEQAEKQSKDLIVIETSAERNQKIGEIIEKHNIRTLGIEDKHLSVSDFDNFKCDINELQYNYISDDIMSIKISKSASEVDIISKNARINDEVFLELIKKITVGVSEMDIYAELTYLFNTRACTHSFTPVIASGENSALPHAPLTNRKIQNGDFLTIDFGAKHNNYCSDCTRTIGVGGLDSEQKKVYYIVKKAQEKALDAIKPGISAKELDSVARDYIAENGYADCFGHGLGHGVGLFIHEQPSINQRTELVLKEGMVITVEPGIYIKGKYGVRIEDLCLVTKGGYRNFNSLYKDLVII